jgi:hypothetical protein
MVRTRITERKAKARGTKGPQLVGSKQDNGTNDGYEIRALQSVISDPEASAMSKVSAARTLAELDGRLGRHQAPPSQAPALSLAILSRDELVHELERLREVCELGLTHWSR